MTGIVFEVFDPELGGTRKLMVYLQGEHVVVRPWDPNWDPVPPTLRSIETRLRLAEGAVRSRGMTGLIDGLPPGAVLGGEHAREKMAESAFPSANARQERQDRLRALIGEENLRAAARQLGAPVPPVVPRRPLEFGSEVPGRFRVRRTIEGRPVEEILAVRPGEAPRRLPAIFG